MISNQMVMTDQEEMGQEGVNQNEMRQEETCVDAEIERTELFCPNGSNGRGFWTFWLKHGEKFTIELHPRYSRVVAILEHARRSDLGLNAAGAGGWRSKSKIADAIGEMNEYRVNESTVTAYVAQIDKRVKKKMRESIDSHVRTETFQVFERRRGLGVRLADGVSVEIIDGTNEEPDE